MIERDLLSDIAHFHTSLRRYFDGPMNAEGTTLAQARLLISIRNAGGMARAADLSGQHGYSAPTITSAIFALEESGFIVRRPDLADRRVKRLAITPAGDAVIAQVEPLRTKLADDVVGVLTSEERALFRRSLDKMRKVLGPAYD